MSDVKFQKLEDSKPVRIACQATEDCPGKFAVILFTVQVPVTFGGILLAEEGGKAIRYRCLTCNQEFQIQQ